MFSSTLKLPCREALLGLVLMSLIVGFGNLRAEDKTSVTVTILRKAPIETLAADGSVTKMTEAVAGTSLMLVSQDGVRVILQDAQGTHYRLALAATDYHPVPSSLAAAPAVPLAPAVAPPPTPMTPPPSVAAQPAAASAPVASDDPLTVDIGTRKTTNAMAVWPPGGIAGQPLLIAAHGHGGNGPGELKSWLGLAKSHHFTIVCPSFMASVNLKFIADDDPYLKDCIKWITENLQYDKDRVFMTGFSGGGYPTWYLATKHDNFFHGIFLQSGNFWGNSYGFDLSRWRDKPIKVIWGSEDLADIPVQGQNALDYLKAHGCRDVTTEVVSGGHHQEHPDMVVRWIESGQPSPSSTAPN